MTLINDKTPIESYAMKVLADIEAQSALLRLDIGSQACADQMKSRLAAIEHFAARGQSYFESSRSNADSV